MDKVIWFVLILNGIAGIFNSLSIMGLTKRLNNLSQN